MDICSTIELFIIVALIAIAVERPSSGYISKVQFAPLSEAKSEICLVGLERYV
jgi:hypothetical protein